MLGSIWGLLHSSGPFYPKDQPRKQWNGTGHIKTTTYHTQISNPLWCWAPYCWSEAWFPVLLMCHSLNYRKALLLCVCFDHLGRQQRSYPNGLLGPTANAEMAWAMPTQFYMYGSLINNGLHLFPPWRVRSQDCGIVFGWRVVELQPDHGQPRRRPVQIWDFVLKVSCLLPSGFAFSS